MSIRFGTDGWRAIIADDFTFDNVRLCTQGVVQYMLQQGLGQRGLVVGFDTRFASEDFARTVAETAAGGGVKVFLCDRPAPTPTVTYNIVDRRAGGRRYNHGQPQPAELERLQVQAGLRRKRLAGDNGRHREADRRRPGQRRDRPNTLGRGPRRRHRSERRPLFRLYGAPWPSS